MPNILFPNQTKYLEDNLSSNDPLFTEMEEFAKLNNVPILERLSADFLEKLVHIYSPKNFLEIGMAIGYSTIRVAKILQKEAYITSIEISKNSIGLACKFINTAEVADKINIIEGDALKIIPNLNEDFDFIFLDSDKEDYEKLFLMLYEKLKVGGIILVDNLLWKGFTASESIPENYKTSTKCIQKFNTLFLNFPGLISSILPIGDGLGLGIKTNQQ